MSMKYELKIDNASGKQGIFREGTLIAHRDKSTGTIDYLPDMDRFRAPVSQWLKDIGEDRPPVVPPEVAARKPVFVGSAAAAPAGAEEEEEAPTPASVTVAPVAPVAVAAPTADQARIAQLEAELASLRAQRAAPAPAQVIINAQPGVPTGYVVPGVGDAPMDPLKLKTYPGAPAYAFGMGDKTPAFITWLAKYHPEDARQRYFGRHIMGGRDINDIIREQAAQ